MSNRQTPLKRKKHILFYPLTHFYVSISIHSTDRPNGRPFIQSTNHFFQSFSRLPLHVSLIIALNKTRCCWTETIYNASLLSWPLNNKTRLFLLVVFLSLSLFFSFSFSWKSNQTQIHENYPRNHDERATTYER